MLDLIIIFGIYISFFFFFWSTKTNMQMLDAIKQQEKQQKTRRNSR